jgi:peroxiredoxin
MKFLIWPNGCLWALFWVLGCATYAASPPDPGAKAPDFSLKTLDNQSIRLRDVGSRGNVVLVVLRGWPGYQCPLCTAQVQDYIANAAGFKEANARVIMIYPGPAAELQAHARDFLKDREWPKEFGFVLDPDFTMVQAYGLRWVAPGETAFPSTFVIDGKGVVRFARISHNHGGRTKAAEVLEELKKLRSKE